MWASKRILQRSPNAVALRRCTRTAKAALSTQSTSWSKYTPPNIPNGSLATLLAAVAVSLAAANTNTKEEESNMTVQPTKHPLPSGACLCESVSRSSASSAPATAKNVMIHRMRSLRGRSLRDKYNVDWKTTLGEGAYGSVHPARLAATGEKVALKKIAKKYTDTSSFRRETDALLRIFNNGGHPNISGLRDMYEDSTHYYLVMDLVSGGEMFDHLIQFGAYSEADAARLMQEVVSALWFLHGVGVVHNDLKPENLLLCSKQRVNGTIKMIDFGCAVVQQGDASDDESETQYTSGGGRGGPLHPPPQPAPQSPTLPKIPSTGTTAYWPPERFAGSMPNSATDMWAVGIILFIMLTGVHPFDLTGVATDADIEAQIKSDPSPPITPGLTSHLSPSAIDLIKKLLQPDARDRITADEMLHHPWVTGDEAATDVMEKSQVKLKKFVDLRNILEAGIFSILVEHGNRDMALSEYAPKLAYRDEGRGGKGASPATSVLKRAFEVFDEEGKGFVSADDLGRVVNQVTGKELTEREKEHMMAATNPETLKDHSTTAASPSMGLSLSKFSKVCGGLKHKHYPRGHIIFHAGDVGDAMYFINSGKVEIQTRKGQLVHILRHGDFFGEGSLLAENETDNRRFSSAKCSTPVDLIRIKKSDFERYIENSKSARDTLKFRWKARSLADAKAMIRLQTNVKLNVLKKGDFVYREGDMGQSMYFVDEERGGELAVKHGDVTVHRYQRGESFGESSLLLERPRSSTVICDADTCYLHEMMGSDFHAFLETSPETKDMLLNMCRKRLFKKAVKAYSLENKRGFSNEDLIKAFKNADTDKSGDLGLDEVRRIMHKMDSTIPEKDIVELLKYIDVDEDGKLSFDDFKRIFRQFENTKK